jgi:N-acetylneuraminate synthase/N,N'-diacetyllegionaminate synthase
MTSMPLVSDNGRVFVIAEAGVNHNGSLDTAKRLVECAAQIGADAVKFQTFRADRLVTRAAGKAEYQARATNPDESQHAMLRRLELDEEAHIALQRHARSHGVTFLSSPFDEDSADLLERLGLECFKIPSGELTNLPLLSHIGRKGRPMIVSTGMATLGEVEQALATIRASGDPPVILLHCVTEYPAPCAEINLRAMETLRRAFGLPVGYSDHTPGFEVPIAAVALGAPVIEKHFTLDRSMPGPDHAASLDVEQFGGLVAAIRNVSAALGDGVKRPAPCEIRNRDVARRSIVAARPIAKGERLDAASLAVKRPGTGIPPADLQKIIGRRAAVALEPDQVLTWQAID